MLNHDEILDRIQKEKLVEDYVDLENQLQPSSFDLTLAKVYNLSKQGSIDFDNKDRVISDTEEIPFIDGWVDLKPGVYKIQYQEIVNVPKDLVGITICRTSLSRCGCDLSNGFWDPGYSGRGTAALMVHNQNGIRFKQRAKVAQIVFLPITEAKQLYQGIHKGENLK